MENETVKKIMTLCFVIRNDQILLGLKKRGFGLGRYNGFGGKVEEGESLEDAFKRELFEESGLIANSSSKSGILEFSFENDKKILEVHLFTVKDFSGEPEESEEMAPAWFGFKEIPFEQMWPDDRYFMPYILEDKKFRGWFKFDRPSDADYQAKIISMDLEEIK